MSGRPDDVVYFDRNPTARHLSGRQLYPTTIYLGGRKRGQIPKFYQTRAISCLTFPNGQNTEFGRRRMLPFRLVSRGIDLFLGIFVCPDHWWCHLGARVLFSPPASEFRHGRRVYRAILEQHRVVGEPGSFLSRCCECRSEVPRRRRLGLGY